MAVDDILAIKAQATDYMMDTLGVSATYVPIDPLVVAFGIRVHISRETETIPDGFNREYRT